ncbi:hypothetical protein D6D01_03888 [Aureobasidium pullulans]|uniref:SET domain-containing protein n=1 Tax=Aureobasidium pullulans TaxID=5580 RepID=A0A4S9LHI4_AURPU|nr:hypothetical protein D6D01_03888 [Aureobasidium pullulans]
MIWQSHKVAGARGNFQDSRIDKFSLTTLEEPLKPDLYPPCAVYLNYLRSNTHHRGCYVVLRAIGEPVIKPIVINAVEDETGEVDRLAIHDVCELARSRCLLPKDTVVAVKEPFYMMTACGSYEIRIDHPCDLVYLAGEDKERNYSVSLTAVRYTFGLDILSDSDDSLQRTLLRNSALVSLFCGKFGSARLDALNSLSEYSGPETVEDDIKGLYRAALALYQQQDYSAAQSVLDELLELAPDDKEARLESTKISARLREQDEGIYDFHALALSMPGTEFFADCASFLRRTEVRQTKGCGSGIFATEDIPAGGLIACEKAYACVHLFKSKFDINTEAALASRIIQRLTDNVWQQRDEKPQTASDFQSVDGIPVIDALRVTEMGDVNSFGLIPNRPSEPYGNTPDIESDPDTTSLALWGHCQNLKHSCLQNAQRSFIGDLLFLRATKHLNKDDEILLSHQSDQFDLDTRQMVVKELFGYHCDCNLCIADRKVGKTVRATREELEQAAKKLVFANQKALAKHAMSLLKRCGFKIEGHDSTGGPCLIHGVNSAMSPMVVVALIYLGRVQEFESQADAYEKLAKEAYIIINVEEGCVEKLSSSIPACGNIRKEKPPTLETINPRLHQRLQGFYDNI